jgi:hypothetical protein
LIVSVIRSLKKHLTPYVKSLFVYSERDFFVEDEVENEDEDEDEVKL